ncbi:unnamed protein product [Prorocentrum cordatum]|uniref:Uncharacterized protein n=1 Tax=Prorocentrum cordatum TaxID=2364126 RepID=A0ABN9W9U6_9DINO|nr:unnamed protein product [Polarella glacialis]
MWSSLFQIVPLCDFEMAREVQEYSSESALRETCKQFGGEWATAQNLLLNRFLPLMFHSWVAPAQIQADPKPILIGGAGLGGFVREHLQPELLIKTLGWEDAEQLHNTALERKPLPLRSLTEDPPARSGAEAPEARQARSEGSNNNTPDAWRQAALLSDTGRQEAARDLQLRAAAGMEAGATGARWPAGAARGGARRSADGGVVFRALSEDSASEMSSSKCPRWLRIVRTPTSSFQVFQAVWCELCPRFG